MKIMYKNRKPQGYMCSNVMIGESNTFDNVSGTVCNLGVGVIQLQQVPLMFLLFNFLYSELFIMNAE